MGIDPMSIKFIQMAHERGLGCGDTDKIEIVGDAGVTKTSWDFVGPFKEMTFASRMQHKIYWGTTQEADRVVTQNRACALGVRCEHSVPRLVLVPV